MVADTRVVREDSDADAKLLVEVEVWLAVPAFESKFDPSILVVSMRGAVCGTASRVSILPHLFAPGRAAQYQVPG